jgi:dephospho-CoA kinase
MPATPRRPLSNSQPPFVGLTGGIGAGKSAALAALEGLGAAVLSTDAVVHELYSSPELTDAVVARFGPDVAPGGTVDRARLAEAAFADGESREWLESLLWPLVGARIVQWRGEVAARDPLPPAAVVEVPLLFEAGMESAFDATIAVIATEELRAGRAAARGHTAVDERTARQLSQHEKAARSTFVIENDGDLADLPQKLSAVLDILGR